MKAILSEILTLFRAPRDLHRVFMIAPLGAMASHAVYLANKSTGRPLTKDDIISIVLAGVLYLLITCWCFLSNPMSFSLSWRFFFMTGWGAIAHRMVVNVGGFSGMALFEYIFAWVCMSVVGFFVVTGMTFPQAKAKFFETFGKKDEKNKGVIAIADRNTIESTG